MPTDLSRSLAAYGEIPTAYEEKIPGRSLVKIPGDLSRPLARYEGLPGTCHQDQYPKYREQVSESYINVRWQQSFLQARHFIPRMHLPGQRLEIFIWYSRLDVLQAVILGSL